MIYLIENDITKDQYIGYTAESEKKRFTRHKLNAKKDGQTYLYRAMRKYGFENFKVSVLDKDGGYDDEVNWISKMKPKYNMTNGGEGGDTSSSPNFKKAMKEYHSNKTKESYATLGMLGKTQSEETRKQQSAKRQAYWDTLSEEDKTERSKGIAGSKNGMFGKSPKNSVQVEVNGVLYNSKAAAMRALGKNFNYIMKNFEVKYVD
tara:strand:+ start:69 stop:683 length:615 start_codon:yes stop_codon:yes gene_type:complete